MYEVGLKSQYFADVSGGSETAQYVPASTGGGVRLRALIVAPDGGGDPGYRVIDFRNGSASGDILFRMAVQDGSGTGGTPDARSTYPIKIPSLGIRFPDGIYFNQIGNYVKGVTVIYEG